MNLRKKKRLIIYLSFAIFKPYVLHYLSGETDELTLELIRSSLLFSVR